MTNPEAAALLLLLTTTAVLAKPLIDDTASSSSDTSSSISAELVSYLSRFGYLPSSEQLDGALITEAQVRDAVRNMQFFAGVNATGRIDADTAGLMRRPRCGVPDVAHPGFRNRRRKRYSLQGQRWSRTNLTWSLNRAPSRSGLRSDDVRRELSQALEMWARQSGLTFTEVSRDGDLRVFFQRGFHGDG